jgi:hypothetical protein
MDGLSATVIEDFSAKVISQVVSLQPPPPPPAPPSLPASIPLDVNYSPFPVPEFAFPTTTQFTPEASYPTSSSLQLSTTTTEASGYATDTTFYNTTNSYFAISGAAGTTSNWYTYPTQNGQIQFIDGTSTITLQTSSGKLLYNSTLIEASNWYTFASQTGEVLLQDASGLQVIQAIGGDLYFNGELLAKASSIQNIADWSLYPAFDNVLFENKDISGVRAFVGSSINVSSIAAKFITAAGLDMANSSISRVAQLTLNNSGAPSYGILTSPDGTLLTWNGQAIATGGGGSAANWSLYNQISSLSSLTATNIIATGTTQTPSIEISGKLAIDGTGSNINVSAGNNGLLAISSDQGMSISTNSNAIAMQAASNVNIVSAGADVNISSYYNTNIQGSDVNIKADTGLSVFNTPIVNIEADNGPLGGQVNLTARASYGDVAGYGRVTINAYGSSSNPSVPIGGLIDLNAYSAGVGSYGGLTSAIRATAATIGISAGAIPSIPATAGSAVIYGNNIVSICAGLPAVFPQIPTTCYLYGFGGLRLDCGTGARVTSLGILQAPDIEADIINANSNRTAGIYFPDPITANIITPQPSKFVRNGGNDLFIRGSNTILRNCYVQIQDVGSIAFAPTLSTNTTGSITGLSTINGSPYPPPATEILSTFQTASISSLQVSSINGASPLSEYLSTFSTFNVSSLAVTAINGAAYPPVVPVISTFDTLFASSFSVSSISNSGPTITLGNPNAYLLEVQDATVPGSNSIGLYSDTGGGVFLGANSNPSIPYISVNDPVNNPGGITIAQPLSGVGAGPILIESGGPVSVLATGGNLQLQASANVYTNSEFDALGATFKAVNNLFSVSSITANISTASFNLQASSIQVTGPVSAGDVSMAALSTTVIKSSGDVVALAAGASPVSLSTVGALVNGNQQYNYWVAVNGSDTTGTGSVLRPFASVTAALAATVSISDAVPINICLAAGTYTENPTLTRNNTFLQGYVGVNDAIIIGTITFNSASASTVSQGINGISVVGNVVCSENTSADVSWYILNCSVTSYTASAISCTSTGSGNNNLTLQNTIVTQNVTANASISMTSARLNVVQSQINNTTAATAILIAGGGSLSLFGATLTCVGGASAAAIVTFLNTVTSGSPNSFTLCSFTYSNVAGGASKTAVLFNNSASLAGLTAFNQNVFNISGSSTLIQKANTGSVAISLGTNTTNVTAVPAASGTLSYAYVPSTPLRANSLFDSNAAAGTANQVLTAGTAGGGLSWATLNVSSLGALAATPSTTAYQSQLVLFNTSTNALSYDANAYSAVIQTAPATVALATTMRGRTYIVTSTGAQTLTFTTATLTANDVGFFVLLKNGNPTGGGDITIAGATGNLVVHNKTATTSGGVGYLYWNGTSLIAY